MTPDGSSAKSNEKGPLAHRGTLTTESSEDYLEAILVIRAERGCCRNADIAERSGFFKPGHHQGARQPGEQGSRRGGWL